MINCSYCNKLCHQSFTSLVSRTTPSHGTMSSPNTMRKQLAYLFISHKILKIKYLNCFRMMSGEVAMSRDGVVLPAEVGGQNYNYQFEFTE